MVTKNKLDSSRLSVDTHMLCVEFLPMAEKGSALL